MSIFKCPNCNDEGLPADEVPCWKCGSRTIQAGVTHQQWREAIARVRSEFAAWGISTDHLSDHELNTAMNNLGWAGVTVDAIGRLNQSLHSNVNNNSLSINAHDR